MEALIFRIVLDKEGYFLSLPSSSFQFLIAFFERNDFFPRLVKKISLSLDILDS